MTATAVYRLFDAADRLLYIGVSLNPYLRLSHHQSQQEWGSEVVRTELAEFESREAVLEAEATAIRTEAPVYNVIGVPRAPRPPTTKYTIDLEPDERRALRVFAFDHGVDASAVI
jgi:predicted GIY-YIG superfamily endonuclease